MQNVNQRAVVEFVSVHLHSAFQVEGLGVDQTMVQIQDRDMGLGTKFWEYLWGLIFMRSSLDFCYKRQSKVQIGKKSLTKKNYKYILNN